MAMLLLVMIVASGIEHTVMHITQTGTHNMNASTQRQVNFDLDRSPTTASPPTNGHLNRLTFVDFSPQTHSSYMKSLFVKQDTYSELINRVNEWLQEHPEWQAKTVESVLFEPGSNLNKSVVHGTNSEQQRKLFAVRLWVCPREDTLQPIQRLKVLNIIPKVKITGCNHELFIEHKPGNRLSFSNLELPTFETIDEIVPHLNNLLKANKYFGQILNIETIAMPLRANKWSVDTEDLEWPAVHFKGVLNILRVHFNERLFMHETVEILDFVPEVETWNAPLAVPNLESFTNVLKRASHALRQRTDKFRFLNCSTIGCPTKASTSNHIDSNFIDSKKTFYPSSEWLNSRSNFSAKFVRIAIARQIGQTENPCSTLLNCKIFVPVKRNQNDLNADGHEMQTLKEAIQNWFCKTEAKVLSVETETIASAITWTSSTTLIDTCLNLNKFPCDILVVFKVYIDGHYVEPSNSANHVNNK